ncbi:M15 family metallopeptidase [Shewanella sp. Isolate11]|uniref:M15 family metallopeptidase n=1 Tax=Shewanella sp. Isolate11 TaxID=2908530 RepID=UPI001EFE5435|nr:M15 family metallopeptidase [Shewanella sp. Isolate11]
MLTTDVYGLGDAPLVDYQGHLLESDTAAQLQKLQTAAAKDDISITICSAYRNFERQLTIWNAKASGQRTLLDKDSQPISFDSLNDDQLIDSILLWSALPGISRHHWGTDVDLFDAKRINQANLKLVEAEYCATGPCHKMHTWLSQYGSDFGFYFPYQPGLSGVSAEPWHLSYYPKAKQYLSELNIEQLRALLSKQDMLLKDAVLARLDSIVNEFAFRIAPEPLS